MHRIPAILAAAAALALAGCAGTPASQTAAAPGSPAVGAAAPSHTPTPTPSPTADAKIPVVYTVTGNAAVRRIDWAGVGGYSNAENVPVPWTQTFEETSGELALSSFSVDVDGSDASTQITCSISVGGKVVVSHSATGSSSMANCAYDPSLSGK